MKTKHLILRAAIFFIPVLFSSVSFSDETSLPVLIRTTAQALNYNVAFPQPTLSNLDPEFAQLLQFENMVGELKQIEIPGCAAVNEPGNPLIPRRPVQVVLPPQKIISSVEVTYSQRIELPGTYTLPYGIIPYRLDEEPIITYPNPAVYNTNQEYPVELHSEFTLQHNKGYTMAVGALNPLEYNPVTGKIYYYPEMTLILHLQDSPDPLLHGLYRAKASDRERVSKAVENPEDLEFYDNLSLPPNQSSHILTNPDDDYEYVIITSQEFAPSFAPLVEDKIARGIDATIITTQEIYPAYPYALDCQDAIRKFIQDAYQDWGIEYVLLGGDADQDIVGGETEEPIVPLRNFTAGYVLQGGTYGFLIAADMYYSCLDGTFDSNGNGYYAEFWYGTPAAPFGNDAEADLFPEIAIGRAPVDSKEEVYNFVMKSLNAISQANSKNALLVGDKMSGIGWLAVYGSVSKERVHQGSSLNGYNTVGFSSDPEWNVETLYDTPTYNYSWPELFEILDRSQPGEQPLSVINFNGVGNSSYLMKFNDTRLEYGRGFISPEYFLLYSQATGTGDFDNMGYLVTQTFRDDCIGEKMLTEPKGAFAVIANSRDGYPAGFVYSVTIFDLLDRQFFDSHLSEQIHQVGYMLSDAKEDLAAIATSWVSRLGIYELNLLGDPEISIDRVQEGAPHLAIFSQEDEHFTSFSKKDLNLEMYLGNWNAFEPYLFNIESLKQDEQGPCSWEVTVANISPVSGQINWSPVPSGVLLSQYAGSGPAEVSANFITSYTEAGPYHYRLTVKDTTNNTIVAEKEIYINVKPNPVTLYVPSEYASINAAVLAAADSEETLILVSPGIYNEGLIDFAGKNIHLKSTAGRDLTTIFGTIYTKQDGLNYHPGHQATIEGLTINGNAQDSVIVSWCKDENNSPNIPEVIIKDNIIENGYVENGFGGGIRLIRSLAVINNNIIRNNNISLGTGPDAIGAGCGIYFNPEYLAVPDPESPVIYAGFPPFEFVKIENNLIYGNEIRFSAGGILSGSGGGMNLAFCFIARNNTIVNNAAVSGGGVKLQYDTSLFYDLKGSAFINNIVYDNQSVNLTVAANYAFDFVSYNCLGDSTSLVALSPTNFNIFSDPLLSSNYRLTLGSPGINAGAPKSLPDPDGTLRDIGCYPFAIYVPQDFPTIREAIEAVPDEGGTIYVDSGTYNEGALYFGGKPILLQSLNGAEQTIVIGSIGLGDSSNQGVFPDNHQSTIDGFTVDGDNTYGPGIESACSENNQNAHIPKLILKNSIIKNCVNNTTGLGGGICLIRSNAQLEWNQIYNNFSTKGAGIYFSENNSFGFGIMLSPSFSRNLIYNNHADYAGGGIYAALFSTVIPPDAQLFFANNTISDNSAGQFAGGVYLDGFGKFNFTNNIIWDNSDPLGSAQLYTRTDLSYDLLYNCLTYAGGGQYFSTIMGNINLDPLLTIDYYLQEISPCIDTGDPNSPLDPDYTRADMGVYYYPHTPMFPKVRAPNAGEEIGNGGG